MSRNRANGFWPELPYGRVDIDHVNDLLNEWGEWSRIGRDEAEKHSIETEFQNSVVHVIECALVLLLLPFAVRAGVGCEVFRNRNELDHALSGCAFQSGYPLELAEALNVCLSLEQPWEMSPQYTEKYVADLTRRLKDIALYQVEPSEFWRLQVEKFTGGRKPGAISAIKKFVAGAIPESELEKTNKELWKVLGDAVRNAASGCPLEWDSDSLVVSDDGKEYVFDRFAKHMSQLRTAKKKNSG